MFLCAVRRKNPWETWAISLAHSFTWLFWAFSRISNPRQLPENATHVKLTVSHSELIVSDSELTFVTTKVFFFLLTHQTTRDRVQILPDLFVWLTRPHSDSTLDPDLWSLSDLTHYLLIIIRSDSLLTDRYPIWLIAYWSLSDLTHCLLIVIRSDSFTYWWSIKLADSYSFSCI